MNKRIMKLRLPIITLFFAALAPVAAAQTHFRFERPVIVTEPTKQNFVVVDESILVRTRPDMGDIRLYSDVAGKPGREVQYVLRTQRATRYRRSQ